MQPKSVTLNELYSVWVREDWTDGEWHVYETCCSLEYAHWLADTLPAASYVRVMKFGERP